jgi:glutamate racemase
MAEEKVIVKNVNNHSPIGVFDSGVGGLTVVREIIRQLPDEKIVYFGDNARVPYGSKSPSTVKHFSNQITRFLLTKEVKAIVVACNTASALALDELKEQFDIPIMGVVIPGARAAIEESKAGKIGVIGTEATIRSGIYSKIIHNTRPDIKVVEKACPLFVPLVEEGFREHKVTKEIIHHYLHSMKEADIDTMILGCTHYPLLRSVIKEYLGEKIHLVNPAYETARDLEELLETANIVGKAAGGEESLSKERPQLEEESLSKERPQLEEESLSQGKYEFYVSDGAKKFHQFANTVMSIEMPPAYVVNIEEY